MSAKGPDFMKLRNQVSDMEERLSFNKASGGRNGVVDIELHSALKTKPKRSNKSYDKELIDRAKIDMELIEKELENRLDDDSFCLSSESGSKLSTSFLISKSSARNRSASNRGLKHVRPSDLAEVVKRLQAIILEKDKRIEVLEEKLIEKQQIAESSLKKLNQTTKLIKVNEKDINFFKKDCEEKLDEYKKIILRLEAENQELNSKLKSRDKEIGETISKTNKFKSKIYELEEVRKQNQELKRKFEESIKLAENLQSRYENLVESSMVFEEKTRDLYHANQLLQENILKLLPED